MLDQMCSNPSIGLHRRFLTTANINRIFSELNVPHNLDLLSIDVDGNDFWLWRALDSRYRPRIVIIEYISWHLDQARLSRYVSSGLTFASSNSMNVAPLLGASAPALVELAHQKGYKLA